MRKKGPRSQHFEWWNRGGIKFGSSVTPPVNEWFRFNLTQTAYEAGFIAGKRAARSARESL